jgi:hypothetical protein
MSKPMHPALDRLAGDLLKLGFKKRAGLIFTLQLQAKSLGWVGINRGSHAGGPGVSALNPVCGVRHQEIEHVVADLLGQKFHAYVPPTVSEPLRYLMPKDEGREWTVTGDEIVDGRVVDDLMRSMQEFGLPYMRDRRGLIDISRALTAGEGHGHQTAFRAPVALWLLGRGPEALAHVDSTLAQVGDRDSEAAEQFRAFAAELAGRIRSGVSPASAGP